jgi:hypothetical protein
MGPSALPASLLIYLHPERWAAALAIACWTLSVLFAMAAERAGSNRFPG